MKAAPKREPELRAALPTEDARRLARLSTIHATLLHCERSEAALRAELREQQIEAREGDAEARLAATKRLEGSREATSPLQQHLLDTREKLHQDAGEARRGLSAEALKLYEGLLR